MPPTASELESGTIDQLTDLFPRFGDVPRDELEMFLDRACARIVEDEPREFILRKGIPAQEINCVLQGWAFRYVVLSDGRRQILAFKTPGSFICVHALCMTELPFSVQAITPTKRLAMNISSVVEESRRTSSVFQALYVIGCQDLLDAEDKMIGLGRRDAMEKISRLLLKIYAKLRRAGLVDARGFEFPLRQTHIADATGLTPVHVNRILRQMRDTGILTIDKGRVEIGDMEQLMSFADISDRDLDTDALLSRRWFAPSPASESGPPLSTA